MLLAMPSGNRLPARAPQRLPSDPPLRNGPSAQHRARPPIARRAQDLAPHSAHAEDSETETSSPTRRCLLRRPDDRHRDVRRSARHAFPAAKSASGSTPHDDRRGASRLATPFLFAFPRAPEQESVALTGSAHSLQAPRARHDAHPLGLTPRARSERRPEGEAGLRTSHNSLSSPLARTGIRPI